MNTVIKQIILIQKIDRLICMRATGSPHDLAYKLGISKTKLYRILDVMKELGAPIFYNSCLQSFVYENTVEFTVGFFDR